MHSLFLWWNRPYRLRKYGDSWTTLYLFCRNRSNRIYCVDFTAFVCNFSESWLRWCRSCTVYDQRFTACRIIRFSQWSSVLSNCDLLSWISNFKFSSNGYGAVVPRCGRSVYDAIDLIGKKGHLRWTLWEVSVLVYESRFMWYFRKRKTTISEKTHKRSVADAC